HRLGDRLTLEHGRDGRAAEVVTGREDERLAVLAGGRAVLAQLPRAVAFLRGPVAERLGGAALRRVALGVGQQVTVLVSGDQDEDGLGRGRGGSQRGQ